MHWLSLLSRSRQICIALLFFYIVLASGIAPQVASAHEYRSDETGCAPISTTSAKTTRPNAQSLLIVMLDRSGSLTGVNGTDPNDLSTSVTRALADLWPGKMAVTTFPAVSPYQPDQIGSLGGIYNLTDSTQRETLKNKIPEPDPNGNTPLGPAMDQALSLLNKGPVPAGSRAIVITDGLPNMSSDPNGQQQIDHIEKDLLGKFHTLGVPINTFGLKITQSSANDLLSTIAKETGASYTPVQSSGELAQQVMQMNADWLGLQFHCATRDTDGTYAIDINDLTRKADIITFRSDPQYPITITTPGGNRLIQGTGVQQSLDKHYEISGLDVAPPIEEGKYKVSVGNDPGAQVYWLVDTRLQVHITAPAKDATVYTGKAAQISAALYKEESTFTLKPGAVLHALTTFTAPGQAEQSSDVTLNQQGSLDSFSGQTPIYNKAGTLKIVVQATYEGTHQGSEPVTLSVQPPPLPPCTSFSCFWQRNQGKILSIGIPAAIALILLLSALLWFLGWRRKAEPRGYLVSARNSQMALNLREHRPLTAKLFSKSIITTSELARHPNGVTVATSLLDEPLAFAFTHENTFLRLTGASSNIRVRHNIEEKQFGEAVREIRLLDGDELLKNNVAVLTFQISGPGTFTGSPLPFQYGSGRGNIYQ